MEHIKHLGLAVAAPLLLLVTALTVLAAPAAVATNGATQRVSVPAGGGQASGASDFPASSADGTVVAFWSSAPNLVPTDTNGVADIFVTDLTGHLSRVSVSSSGLQANGASYGAALSDDGNLVAFSSSASNLVSGDTNNKRDVFVRDWQAGTTERISVATGGLQGDGDAGEGASSLDISGDGRFVVFQSAASNMIANYTTINEFDIYLHDRQTGATSLVSQATNGAQANGYSGYPTISSDGRFIAFYSAATNLDGRAAAAVGGHIYVRDQQLGQTQLVTVASDNTAANGASSHPALSSDGRYVAFESAATNLVPGDTNGQSDIFVRDLQTGVTTRVSVASDGAQADYFSRSPSVSGDGRFVVFASGAHNLVPNDTSLAQGVYVHDRLTGATTLLSVGRDVPWQRPIAKRGHLWQRPPDRLRVGRVQPGGQRHQLSNGHLRDNLECALPAGLLRNGRHPAFGPGHGCRARRP